ncbi:MAG: hypothetical protein ACRDT5_05950 [Mycobacterium sp.]
MTYVIGKACVDAMHKSCVQECPVDRIYRGVLFGSPGGAAELGPVGADTPLVAAMPRRGA